MGSVVLGRILQGPATSLNDKGQGLSSVVQATTSAGPPHGQ